MTHTERVHALRCWGYSPTEAEFLVIAALCSGYFIRREYDAIHQSGSQTVRFLEKLQQREHVRVLLSERRKIFHLKNAAMYRRLGDPNSRNRRLHSLSSVRERLMGLDFLLSESDGRPLLTAEEKHAHLVSLGVPENQLPSPTYRRESKVFPGYGPMTAGENGAVTFAWVDPGTDSADNFARWLAANLDIFRALPRLQVVCVSAYPEVEQYLRPVFDAAMVLARPADYGEPLLELLPCFELDLAAEEGKPIHISADEIATVKRRKKQYGTYEAMYQDWKRRGLKAVAADAAPFRMLIRTYNFYSQQNWGSLRSSSSSTLSDSTPLQDCQVSATGDS